MKKILLALFTLCMMFTGITFLNTAEVNAATPAVKYLSYQKKYTTYDITNDGQNDSIYITGHYDTRYQEYDSCMVYINDSCSLNMPISEPCYSIKAKLIILKNNKRFLLLQLTGDNDAQDCGIYQYQSDKLVKVVDLDSVFGNKYGYDYNISKISVSGNTVGVDFRYMSTVLGISKYYYTYSYKNGTMKQNSNTGKVTAVFHSNYKYSNNCKLKKNTKIYKKVNSSYIKTLSRNTTVKVVNVSYSSKSGMWLKVKYGSKYGWIKAPSSTHQLFNNVVYAG